jgi:sulfite oxidase
LKKVLKYCGLKDEGAHVEFFGADTYFKKGQVYNYAVSVPIRKVKVNEVLLAWEMNGKPLPAIHGFPLRVVVMGYIGARSCKWLTRINVISNPSLAPVQMKEYLYYTPQLGKQNVTYSNGFSIQTMPVASAIMTPLSNDVIIHDGKISFTGWAYSGSGWPERVEVSPDGGGVWYEVPNEQLSKKYYHAWRTWSFECPVDAEGWLEFCVRCWDDALNVSLPNKFVQNTSNLLICVLDPAHLRPQRLELGPTRDLLVPPDQTLQREQEQTRHCAAAEAVRGQGTAVLAAHAARAVRPRDRGGVSE